MCLDLIDTPDVLHFKREIKKLKGKPFIAYKVLIKDCDILYSSYYHKANWKIGEVYRSDRRTKKLDKIEKRQSIVLKGVHTYATLRGAEGEAFSCTEWIYPVLIYPKDIVDIGLFCDEVSIVAMKVTLLKPEDY